LYPFEKLQLKAYNRHRGSWWKELLGIYLCGIAAITVSATKDAKAGSLLAKKKAGQHAVAWEKRLDYAH